MKQRIIILKFLAIMTLSLPQISFADTTQDIVPKTDLFDKISEKVKLLDTKPPAPPTNISVAPSDWTKTDSFTIIWQNPQDKSGIKGCYYKLDNLPVSNNDGIYVEGDGINSLTEIKVNTDGAHLIYIWLKDKQRNVDYHNYAVGVLKLDQTAPEFEITSPQNESWMGIE